MRRGKEETCTSLVLTALVARDDFTSELMLRVALPQLNVNQISATLFHLRRRRAVDVVIEPDGVGWWYATPETDNRAMRYDLRTPESKPRTRKKGYKRKKP